MKIIKIIGIYILVILSINSILGFCIEYNFEPAVKIYNEGRIIKLPAINYSMVFAHGNYKYINCTRKENITAEEYSKVLENCTFAHYTEIGYETILTKTLLDNLYKEGYTRVWLSQCHTGNEDYMVLEPNGSQVEWYDWVSRNRFNGRTMPIFTGINFIRIPLDIFK